MTDSRNGELLLGGGGGEEGTRAAKEDLLELPRMELVQQLRAQHHGAAPASGASRMDILPDGVVDQIPAVRQLAPNGDPRLPAQPHQRLHPDGTQVSGDDEVVILRRGLRVLQMGADGLKCGGG